MARFRNVWLPWPALLYLVVFFFVPISLVAAMSILKRDEAGGVHAELSAEAWRLATSSYTLTILARTLEMALAVTLLCLVVAYPCAMTLIRLERRWRNTVLALLSFPLITSLLLRIFGWDNLLAFVENQLPDRDEPVWLRGTFAAVVLVEAVNYYPFMLLPLVRSLERQGRELHLAAADLGATPWQTFWHVTWPLSRPGMLAGCVLVFIPTTGEFLVPNFVGNKMLVLGTLIVREFDSRNWPYVAAAAVWLLALVVLPVVLWSVGKSRPLPDPARGEAL